MAEYITIMVINNKTAGDEIYPIPYNTYLLTRPTAQITGELEDRESVAT
jgi:hypothetical protein